MSATIPPEQPVLIVDDEAESREALSLLLEYEGYRVALAANGEEALRYLQERPAPCLILLDLQMPVMDGREFLRRQQAEERLARIPVLVISGGVDRRTTATLRGAVGLFTKPVRIKALLAEMEQWCQPLPPRSGRQSQRDGRESAQPLPRAGPE
jgi:CheY-like chemotaxis protein